MKNENKNFAKYHRNIVKKLNESFGFVDARKYNWQQIGRYLAKLELVQQTTYAQIVDLICMVDDGSREANIAKQTVWAAYYNANTEELRKVMRILF